MGSVYRKRSRGKDLGFYVADIDADGRRRHAPSHQPSRKDALVLLAEIEGRVRRGAVGVPEPEESVRLTVRALVARYLEGYSSPLTLQQLISVLQSAAGEGITKALPLKVVRRSGHYPRCWDREWGGARQYCSLIAVRTIGSLGRKADGSSRERSHLAGSFTLPRETDQVGKLKVAPPGVPVAEYPSDVVIEFLVILDTDAVRVVAVPPVFEARPCPPTTPSISSVLSSSFVIESFFVASLMVYS